MWILELGETKPTKYIRKGRAGVPNAIIIAGGTTTQPTKGETTARQNTFKTLEANQTTCENKMDSETVTPAKSKDNSRWLEHLCIGVKESDPLKVQEALSNPGVSNLNRAFWEWNRDKDKSGNDPSGAPLHQAAEKGSYEIVTMLLAAGFNVDSQRVDLANEQSMTSLHAALLARSNETIDLLLKAGANVSILGFYEDEEHGKLEGDAFAWANRLGLTSILSDLALPLAGNAHSFVTYNQTMEEELTTKIF